MYGVHVRRVGRSDVLERAIAIPPVLDGIRLQGVAPDGNDVALAHDGTADPCERNVALEGLVACGEETRHVTGGEPVMAGQGADNLRILPVTHWLQLSASLHSCFSFCWLGGWGLGTLQCREEARLGAYDLHLVIGEDNSLVMAYQLAFFLLAHGNGFAVAVNNLISEQQEIAS